MSKTIVYCVRQNLNYAFWNGSKNYGEKHYKNSTLCISENVALKGMQTNSGSGSHRISN